VAGVLTRLVVHQNLKEPSNKKPNVVCLVLVDELSLGSSGSMLTGQ